MKQNLIIIRGCPAVGKGTLANELAGKLKGKLVKLTLDDFQWEIIRTKKRTKKDFELAFKTFLNVLEEYLKNNYDIIVEDIWTQYDTDKSTDINKVIELGKKYHTKTNLFLLKAKWTTIKARNSIRHRIMKEDELKDVYDKIYSKTLDKEFVLDIDGKSKEQIVREVLKLINH